MTSLEAYLAAGCKKYGYSITSLEYRALYRAQGGRCYVCRKATGKARRLAVDHNHLTGEVRGLVCSGSLTPTTCNRLIAYYDRAQLLRAAEMLSDPPPARVVLTELRQGRVIIQSLVRPGTWFRVDSLEVTPDA